MKKGFTLIELLGVIVILSVLMMFVFPNVVNFIKKSNSDKDNYTLRMIKNAADIYVKEHKNELSGVSTYCIPLETLVSEGNLRDPITLGNNDTDLTHTKSILMPYNESNLKLSIVDKTDSRC